MQQQVMDMLLEQEEVGWKTILYDLVKTEQMDPWDINLSLLTKKYLEAIHKMQESNLRISGKILLAAAFLLRIKSSYLVDHDIFNLDKLINSTEENLDEDLLDEPQAGRKQREKFQLIPRNPQPRNRKVSINDLIEALQRAMASKKRILEKQRPVKFIFPSRKIDIMEVIRDLYYKIIYHSEKNPGRNLTFTELLPPKAGKREKVYTFIPLLHLENEQRVETAQEKPFEEIYVKLLKKAKSSPAAAENQCSG